VAAGGCWWRRTRRTAHGGARRTAHGGARQHGSAAQQGLHGARRLHGRERPSSHPQPPAMLQRISAWRPQLWLVAIVFPRDSSGHHA
jgi:hypothetical protein